MTATAPVTPIAARVCGIGDEAAPGALEQIRLHAQLGLRGLELRTVDGFGLHELPERAANVLAEWIASVRLVVPVVDTPIGGWSVSVAIDLDDEIGLLVRCAQRAELFGCRRLRVMSYPNDGRPAAAWRAESIRRMRVLANVAADLDVVLLHENCHGWASQSVEHTSALLSEVDSPHLRLLFDIGNGVAYGYQSLPFLAAVLPWVEHVHVKDGRRDPGQDAVFGMPGQGTAQVEACVRLLEEAGYTGWYSVEPHLALIPHLGLSPDDPDRQAADYRSYVEEFVRLAGRVEASRVGP